MSNYEVAANVRQVLENQIFILVQHLHFCLGSEHRRLSRPCDLLILLRAVSNDIAAALPHSCTRLRQCCGSIIEGISKIIYEGHLESKERFAVQRYLLIIGKKMNVQVL